MIQHAKILFNGAIVDEMMPRRWPTAEELLDADGVFETIKVLRGQPVFFSAHHARLSASVRSLGLPWKHLAPELRTRCLALLQANRVEEGSLKIVVYRDGTKEGVGELIFSREPAYSVEDYQRGFQLKTQPDLGRPPGAAHKSTRYRKNLQAREVARAAGGQDALFVDSHGRILEGAATNLFLVVGGALVTPPLEIGILPGVARGEILRRWKSGVKEQVLTVERLDAAEEAFVTNALVGVMPVLAIDQHMYPMNDYKVTPRVMAEFSAWQEASIDG